MKISEAKQRVEREGGIEMVRYYSTYHLMARYSWNETKVKEMKNLGMPYFKDGRKNKYDPEAVEKWLVGVFFVAHGESLDYCDNNNTSRLLA